MASASVSVSIPIWLFQELEQERKDLEIGRSQYIVEVLRDHKDTPFEPVDEDKLVVCRDENGDLTENVEGAA
jgi:hypothetical protein